MQMESKWLLGVGRLDMTGKVKLLYMCENRLKELIKRSALPESETAVVGSECNWGGEHETR